MKNKVIKYVGCVAPFRHEWDIDGKKVVIAYFTPNYSDELGIFINRLEDRLTNKSKLTTDEDKNIYGRRWSVPNTFEVSATLFPKLTRNYIKHFIDISISEKNEFSSRSLYKLMARTSQNRATSFPSFSYIMHTEQIKKMKEIGVFKYAFTSKYMNDNITEFVSRKGNYYVWKINNKITELIGFTQKDEHLLNQICFEIQKRLEHNEPILSSRCTCHTIKMGKKNIVTIAGDIFADLAKKYIEKLTEVKSKDRELVGSTYIYSTILSYDKLSQGYELNDTKFDTILRGSLEKSNTIYLDKFIKSNFTEGTKGDLWRLYQKQEGTSYGLVKLDFSNIDKPLLKAEVKAFLKDELLDSDDYNYQSYSLRKLQVGLDYILRNFEEVNSCADISVNIVIALRDFLQTKAPKYNGDMKIKVSTQAKIMQKFKQLFDFLMHNDSLAIANPMTNPFSRVSYHNIDSMEKNTEPLSEDVINSLLGNIDDLEPMYQRILLISLNTGLRFKEIKNLDKNSLYYDEENKAWKLEYIPWKILDARRKRNLDDYTFIVIQDFLVKEIKNQIVETEALRNESKSDKIFLKRMKTLEFGRKTITTVSGADFNSNINKVLKKHNIVDSNGKPCTFNHIQCRKTLAVDMITNGMSSQEVTYQLGHLNSKTTEKYYSEVRKYKLADMNSDFFKKKFNLLVTDEQLLKYSEEERRLLYIGFCTDYREVELGKCIKPFSEGKCKRSGNYSCATCDKLCVSYDNFPKWEKLYNSKKDIIQKMKKLYEREGISATEYTKFREYQKELHLYNAYKDIFDKLKLERI